ncbi:MAG: Ig-like domain-containing protein [Patescibacteria group bacterium]
MEISLQKIPTRLIRLVLTGVGILILVIIVVALVSRRQLGIPQISQTIPSNGEENIIPSLPLVISFDQDLSAGQQNQVSFSTNPLSTLKQEWIARDTLQLSPVENLSFATGYEIQIIFRGRTIHEFSFETINTTAEKLSQEVAELAQGDVLFAQAAAEWYRINPWYSQFPLITEKYTIVYEPDTNKFRIRLTLGHFPTRTEISNYTESALRKIELTGASLEKIGYYVIYE